MSRRSAYHAAVLVWLALFFLAGFAVWSFQAGHLMLVGFLFLSAVLYALHAFLTRCPRCRTPVLLRPVRAFGVELYAWSIVMPGKCRHCGTTLS